jgi:hypothetical protein
MFVFNNLWIANYVFSDRGVVIITLTIGAFEILIVCMMIPLGLMALGRAVNGRELLFGGAVREISVQSVPDSSRGVEVRTLPIEPKSSATLRHSIYENSQCGPETAKWLLTHREGPVAACSV